MILYFSASSRSIDKDIEVYRRILHKLYELEHVLVNDWIEVAYHRAGRFVDSNNGQVGWNIVDIVRNAEVGIEQAEAVIAEVSGGSTFGVGFEVSHALRSKKPVLCLIKEEEQKNSYAAGLKSDLLTIKFYNEKNLDTIVEQFIKENTLKLKDLRFNFVMDRRAYNHLRSKSFELGKTKAEVLRDLLLRDIGDN
jgi:nucleoside 2-deoxyribosyltransferase